MGNKNPPFKITNKILSLSEKVNFSLGELNVNLLLTPQIKLRRENQIKTIHSSLAIEGNAFSEEQITAIVNGMRVIGDERQITEVKNALEVYDNFDKFKYNSITALKKAHKILMRNLSSESGRLRSGNVGIFAGKKLVHMAPQPKFVSKLMDDLFNFLTVKDDISLLLKACIFHYELEFIHPFDDGNGRMGRLWQQLILSEYHEIFKYVSIESIIKENQQKYYTVLAQADEDAESTCFIEFMLEMIFIALQQLDITVEYSPATPKDRLLYAKKDLETQWFSRKDYIAKLQNISTATASRDLKFGIIENILAKKNSGRLTLYSFK